ncbi:Nn.00g059540.m01.CDS01 [Neocucurbitaria sp. VM-36]
MFTFQTMARKRGRDDDSDSDEGYGREIKKSRPWSQEYTSYGHRRYPSPSNLPHRPSLTPSPPRIVTDIEAMTPAQSDYRGSNSPKSIHEGPTSQSSQFNTMDYDMDMEEDDLDVRSQPPESPAFSTSGSLFMRPAMLKPSLFGSESANTGRVPTPIHPTFKRGGMHGLGYPTSGSAGSISTSSSSLGGLVPSIQAPPPARKGHNRQDLDDDRSRRMPSPISEDEDIPDTPTALTQSQLSRLSFSHQNADQMETEVSSTSLALLPPPTPRGRKRSGALTGMGRFSMGYRDDCEKCRQRVPGHYSHFLP